MTTPGAGLGADVALVLVNYGSSTLIEHNMDGVDLGHARVVVVDNLTTAAEREAVTLLGGARGWDVLVPDSNLGFGSGMNLGVAHAMAHGATVCVLLNPDLHAPGATLTALAEAVRTDPSALVCPRIVRPDGSVWFTGGDVWVERGRTRTAGADATSPTGWLTGACLAVSSSLWAAAGGFDDDYFLYWEDVDLSWRVRAAGGHLRVLADVEAVHDVG
ncbi:MAG: glycosyltransferase family 2 protein, partial [Cellulomonadaceae bacterium]|nr:glycosyltransferase family 2 protein [Cellulomonadaceae bacterium]